MTGEEAKLFQSFQSVIRQAGKFEDSLEKSGQAAKKLSAEERAMAREAKRAFEEAKSPLDKYNQAKQTLDSLLKKGKISQDEYNAAVRRAKTEMDQAADSGDKAFGSKMHGMVTQLLGALGLSGGVAGAIQLVRAEYEQLIEAQREAAAATLTQAQAQEVALVNLGATTEAQRDKFTSAARVMAGDLGVSETEVYRRSSDALSARGDKPIYGPGGAMDAVRASFGFARGDSAAGMAAAGAALDLSAITGGSAEQSLGFLQAVGQRARITDPRKLATNLPPAMKAAVATGADPQEAGALFAAVTQGMADPTGESSRTATISFVQQLRDRYEKELDDAAKLVAKGKMSQTDYQALEQKAERWSGLSLTERLTELQADPTGQQVFLAGASFEKRAQVPMEELVRGGGAAKAFAEFRTGLPGMEAAGEFFAQAARVRSGAGAQQVADMERAVAGIVEQAATGDIERAGMGVIRERFGPALRQAGLGSMASRLAGLQATLRGDDLEAFEAQLRGEASLIKVQPQRGYAFGAAPRGGGLTKQEQEQARLLTALADAIGKLNQAAEAQQRAAEAQERAQQAGASMVAPNEDR